MKKKNSPEGLAWEAKLSSCETDVYIGVLGCHLKVFA